MCKEGTPTVYLCFTSALSSSYNSACQAADAVRAEYPILSCTWSTTLCPVRPARSCARGRAPAFGGTDRQAAGRLGKRGKDLRPRLLYARELRRTAAGGRIPPAAAQLTAKLDVKPELSYDLAGSLSLIGVNRGRKKALKSILKSFRENYVPDRTMPIAIMTADAEKDGDWLEAAIRKEEGCADVTIIRGSVGPTIGSHVGPGMVGCAFWGKNRADKASLSDRIARRVRVSRQALRPLSPSTHSPNAGTEYPTW
ncbi:MAG: DegV family protein [Collinsella sp.]